MSFKAIEIKGDVKKSVVVQTCNAYIVTRKSGDRCILIVGYQEGHFISPTGRITWIDGGKAGLQGYIENNFVNIEEARDYKLTLSK